MKNIEKLDLEFCEKVIKELTYNNLNYSYFIRLEFIIKIEFWPKNENMIMFCISFISFKYMEYLDFCCNFNLDKGPKNLLTQIKRNINSSIRNLEYDIDLLKGLT